MPLTLAVVSDEPCQAGLPYAQQLQGSGGTPGYAYAITGGSLPPGITLDATTGLIAGTPALAGWYIYTVTVTDATSATANLTISKTVLSPGLSLTGNPPAAVVGTAYSYTLQASGGATPYIFTFVAGSGMGGLSIDLATGEIHGTPTTPGTATFTAQLTDANNQITLLSSSIVIQPAASTGPLEIGCNNPPTGQVAQPYSHAVTYGGGTAPYTVSLPGAPLPPGLSIDAAGNITGTPTTPNTYLFVVEVTDNVGATASVACSITITAAPPPPSFLSYGLANFTNDPVIGQSYAARIYGVGGLPPYTYSVPVGQLPPGISLDPAQGYVTGIPTQTGTWTATLQVRDASLNTIGVGVTLTVVRPDNTGGTGGTGGTPPPGAVGGATGGGVAGSTGDNTIPTPPIRTPLLDAAGNITKPWVDFFTRVVGIAAQGDGSPLPRRPRLNFVGATGITVTVADNPDLGRTDITIST